jgi:rubrerythrin
MPDSHDNLKEAFAGESQANRKYTYFAAKAEEEGYPQVARLFRAAAAAEAIHAYNHLKALGGIGATAENLQAAIAGETYEVTNMYPPFIEQAGQEGNRKAATSFNWANEVEKIHAQMYQAALDSLAKGFAEIEYYVCPVCGYTHAGPPPERCPVCNTPGERFGLVD